MLVITVDQIKIAEMLTSIRQFIPADLKIKKTVEPVYHGSEVFLVRTKKQKHHGVIMAHDILADLHHGYQPLDSVAADKLLENQKQIPEEWQAWKIFFWGTIFEDQAGRMSYVRYIHWDKTRRVWQTACKKLHAGLDTKCLAACIRP